MHYFEITRKNSTYSAQSSLLFIHILFAERQSANHQQIFREEIHTTNVSKKGKNPRRSEICAVEEQFRWIMYVFKHCLRKIIQAGFVSKEEWAEHSIAHIWEEATISNRGIRDSFYYSGREIKTLIRLLILQKA